MVGFQDINIGDFFYWNNYRCYKDSKYTAIVMEGYNKSYTRRFETCEIVYL